MEFSSLPPPPPYDETIGSLSFSIKTKAISEDEAFTD